MAWTVTQAFDYFLHAAESVGAAATADTRSGPRLARVTRDRAELRLTWSANSQRLTLEISQGPPDGPAVDWVELFGVGAVNDILLEPSDSAIDFESSVSYGFELMGFPNVVPAA